MDKKQKMSAFFKLLVILIAILFLGSSIFVIGINMMSNRKTQSLQSYYGDYDFATINGTFVNIGNYDEMYLGEPSLPVSFIKDYIDRYMFWEPEANQVTVTTESDVIKMKTDDLTYYINGEPLEFQVSSYRDETMAYIPKSILETLYPVKITYNEDSGIIVVEDERNEYVETTLKKKTPLKYKADKKSANSTILEKGETVLVFPDTDDDKYTKIQTSDGYVGYVPTKVLKSDYSTYEATVVEEQPVHDLEDEKIMLLWDQVTTTTAANNRINQEIPEGVNVLSPTFFSFDTEKNDGTITSIASSSYVKNAHDNGVQVWALITDNFSVSTNDIILRDPDTRQYVIDQIIGYVRLYNLDGINIDFEAVPDRNGEYFIQFLRELYPRMKEEGAILSVDTYVPSAWSTHYDREAIAETADYVCVMAYDEHTSSSETTGPVASKDFVDAGIADTLTEVPKEQVILGVPFYTRVWRVNAEDSSDFSIRNYSMDTAYEIFRDNNAQFTFDDDSGYYYARYEAVEDGEEVYYEAWFENEDSLQTKMDIYNKYDVQGVAMWKRGLEQDNSYSIIEENLNK